MAAKKSTQSDQLAEQAKLVREALPPNQQSVVFKLATEAGYLTGLADGVEDVAERAALVRAVEALSQGLVLEWEVDDLLSEAAAALKTEGVDARAKSIGKQLTELGAADAGILIAAIVGLATSGIDKTEASVLEKIGTAAGLAKPQIGALVKKAR
ncbi:MAG: hypothetical protein ABI175_24950 [Polyangiales bacterium]